MKDEKNTQNLMTVKIALSSNGMVGHCKIEKTTVGLIETYFDLEEDTIKNILLDNLFPSMQTAMRGINKILVSSGKDNADGTSKN